MKMLKIFVCLCASLSFTNITAQNNIFSSSSTEKRIALVIGNGQYSYSGELTNPVNDAKAMKATLSKVGFTVFEYENLSQAQMKKVIDDFGTKLKQYTVGLFFYAGHGIQSKGYNYLIPIDANLETEQQIEYDCVQADRVLGLMEAAGSKINIVILDACRNNPFERSWSRSTNGSGLAFMNAPSGSLIAYATSPGRTASDGSGSNGLYTSALLENIQTPNITILQMFQNVRRTVSEKSYKQQIPWESTSLTADFYFVPNAQSSTNTSTNPNTNTKTISGNITNTSSSTIKNVSQNTNNKSKSHLAVSSEEKNTPSLTTEKQTATWKHQGSNFWFYLNGEEVGTRVKSAWSDDDLLVYDPVSYSSYLLKDFLKKPENQSFNAQFVSSSNEALWRRKDDLFWLYVNGEQIAKRTKSVWVDNDILVFDEQTNTTYILKDYKFNTDNVLRPAVLFDNAEFVFWRRQDNSYWLYAKGEQIQSRTKSGWVDNDLLVYDNLTNTTYMLKDYSNEANTKLKPAQVISYIDDVFWRKKDNLYWLYVKGEQVASRTTNKWVGNDLYVTDTSTNITYILQDYANAIENNLRPAVKYVQN